MRSTRLAKSLFLLLAAVGALSTGAHAQSSTAAARPGASSDAGGLIGSGTESPRDIEITLPSVTTSGPPRSYQVVSIPLPDALANAQDVDVVLVARGDFAILGSLNRSLRPRSGQKRIGVTIGVPATALAGRFTAAQAYFVSPGSATMVVPIEIEVTLVRNISLRMNAGPLNAQAGSETVLRFDVTNSGNSVENLKTALTLPAGWATREGVQPLLAIGPAETVKRRVRLKIPALSSTGSSFIHIALLSGNDTLAAESATIEVFNSSSIGQEAGPVLTSALTHAVDETGRSNELLTFSATGALYDSVHVDARFSQGTTLGAAASNSFAHLGSYQSSASMNLSGPSGQLSLGNTGTSFSELTGLYPYGQGALLHYQHPAWSVLALGAMSMQSNYSSERKPMYGLRAERQVGIAQLSASASHLADTGPSPRQLDAVGIAAAVPAPLGSTFKAEVAERRFQGGDGLGWSSALVRISGASNEEFRLTHAPGGSDAFARATNEVVANVSERLSSRASMSASGWRTTDETSVFSGLTSNGFSVRPQYTLFGATTMALEARSYLFEADSRPTTSTSLGRFGNREQQLGLSVNSYLHQYYINSAAFFGTVTRTVTPSGDATIADRTPRNYWNTSAGWSGPGGTLELQMHIEQTRDRVGFVNQQSLFGIRADEVVLPWLGGLRGEGELQRINGFGGEKSAIMRAGLAVPLTSGFAIKVDVERNSIFHSPSGSVPWIFGARVEHSIMVPMLRTPGTSGYVYRDLNGNQRRDAGEPGVAGAIVRRGGESVVANESGKYHVGGDARQPVVVDEASLPDGWSSIGGSRGDLGVSLSAAAEVELVVAPRSGIAAVQVDLSKAHAIARDSTGREWGAVMTGPTTATFQSLPVGRYTLEFDLSELTEPLVPRGPLPVLEVTGVESKSVTVTLDPRPIRMWNGGSARSGSQKNAPKADDKQSPTPRNEL